MTRPFATAVPAAVVATTVARESRETTGFVTGEVRSAREVVTAEQLDTTLAGGTRHSLSDARNKTELTAVS